jgi:hypothetical protein
VSFWSETGIPDHAIPARTIEEGTVPKDHGPSVKNDKQYQGMREKGMSKSRAAAISNSPGASSKGGKKSS